MTASIFTGWIANFTFPISHGLRALADWLSPPPPDQIPLPSTGEIERSRLIEVRFFCPVPDHATREQIEEWVAFSLGDGSIGLANPLQEHELEVFSKVSIGDTGMHMHVEARRNPDGVHITSFPRREPYRGSPLRDIMSNPNHPAIQD